jgi:hypothetical protein
MKKLLLILMLIPNLVMGENQLNKGIMCKSGSKKEFNIWCTKNKCVEYKIYGYKVLEGHKWKAMYEGSTIIMFYRLDGPFPLLTLDRESLKMKIDDELYNCKVALKKSDITDFLYEKIANSKKVNKI